jgi:hypothetical protein
LSKTGDKQTLCTRNAARTFAGNSLSKSMMKTYFKSIRQYAGKGGKTVATGDRFKNGAHPESPAKGENSWRYMLSCRIYETGNRMKGILKMEIRSVKIRFFVWLSATLAGISVLSAQDVTTLQNGGEIKVQLQQININGVTDTKFDHPVVLPGVLMQSGDSYVSYGVADTANRQLRYSHNFQSGIPALDNYLDIKLVDGSGKKLKKSELRSILADVPEALDKYNSGVRLYTAAAVIGVASIGILIVRLSNPPHKYFWMSVGIGCSTSVVICRIVGTAKLKSAMKLHNGADANRPAANLSLNFGVTDSGGLGLMLNF